MIIMGDFFIDSLYITLGKFLKANNIISSGGEAKYFLADNEILVNNVLEQRRNLKLYDGNIVSVNGKEYQIKCI